jgi:hypothetical protein
MKTIITANDIELTSEELAEVDYVDPSERIPKSIIGYWNMDLLHHHMPINTTESLEWFLEDLKKFLTKQLKNKSRISINALRGYSESLETVSQVNERLQKDIEFRIKAKKQKLFAQAKRIARQSSKNQELIRITEISKHISNE